MRKERKKVRCGGVGYVLQNRMLVIVVEIADDIVLTHG